MATHCIFILAVDTTLMLAPADDGILLARTSNGKSESHHSNPVRESAGFDVEGRMDCRSNDTSHSIYQPG